MGFLLIMKLIIGSRNAGPVAADFFCKRHAGFAGLQIQGAFFFAKTGGLKANYADTTVETPA